MMGHIRRIYADQRAGMSVEIAVDTVGVCKLLFGFDDRDESVVHIILIPCFR